MITRYFGIDIHKRYAMVAAVDHEHQVQQPPVRVPMAKLASWAAAHISQQDEVVVEVTTNTWKVVDLLRLHAGRVGVADPYKTKLIAHARIKNDKVDALALAHLLASGFLCEVWVPGSRVRQQRILATHRAGLQRQSTRLKNRVHDLLTRCNLVCPVNSPFSSAGRDWLEALPLPEIEALQVRHWLVQLDLLGKQLDEADRLLARQASQDPRVPQLMQVTGVGYLTAYTALAAIGDIQRFPTPGELTAYAGLVPRQHQSGNRSYHGHITKAGNRLLGWLMVEAARSAIRFDPHWQQVHDRIARRRGTNIATVAVARKMLVVLWHLLKQPSPYHHLRPQAFVTKLQQWAYRIGSVHLPAETAQEFVKRHLCALDLDDLAHSLQGGNRNGRLRVPIA
jgi:transposase